MKHTHLIATTLLLTLAWCGARAQSPSPTLLVLAKSDRALFIVDPATQAVLAQVPSGPDPHEVVASSDGRVAYISNYGGGVYNTITVVDLVARRALPAIDLGALRGPHGLTFVAGKLWFTAEGAKAVASYDPATRTIDWILGTGQDRTHMLVVSDDAKRIVTTNVSSATVTIAELTPGRARGPGGPPPSGPGGQVGTAPIGTRGSPAPGGGPGGGPGGAPRAEWQETVVAVGNGAEGFDVAPDGTQAWIANAQDGTISVIDLGTKRVLQTIAAEVPGANRLKITPNGKQALVSTLGGANLTVLDVASRAVVKRISIGHGAAGIQITPDGARAYVACTADDYVAIVDLETLTMSGHIAAGKQPDGLAWSVRR